MPTVPLDELTPLLLDLAGALHGAQLPGDQIEGHVRAIAGRFGVAVDPILLQSFLAIEARRGGGRDVALRRIDFDPHWRLARLQDLVALADDLGPDGASPREGRARLAEILGRRARYPHAAVLVAYGVYGAVVAARVGGGGPEMAVAGGLGLAAGLIHVGTTEFRRVDLQKSLIAGFVGSALALLASLALPPFGFAHALFGGMVLLIPAMPIVLGVHELAGDALEAGAARLAYGLLRFAMLGAGIAAALRLWSLALPPPPDVAPAALSEAAVLGLLALGGAALVVCLQARARDAPWMIAAALIAFGAQRATKAALGDDGSPALAAFALGVVAFAVARRPGRFAATMLVPGVLQLAPGFLGTESIMALLHGRAGGDATFVRVVLVAIELTVGFLVAGVLFGRDRPWVGGRLQHPASAPTATFRSRA